MTPPSDSELNDNFYRAASISVNGRDVDLENRRVLKVTTSLSGGGRMKVEFVDADAHVVEAEMAPECLKRWPNEFTFDAENRQIRTEGRRYPEFEGPGAGCPPEHGLSTSPGINPYTPEGTLADADKDGIDVMVFY